MKYEDYVQLQIGGEGHLNKPIRYAKGEQRAIDWFMSHEDFEFVLYVNKYKEYFKILSIGCGEGWGINYFNQLGQYKTWGIDLHTEKLKCAKLKSINSRFLSGSFEQYIWNDEKFDLFWCSHFLEHSFNIEENLFTIWNLGREKSRIFIVLPYPDLDPAPAHTASKQLGLNIEDEGKTVIKFFEDRGFKLVRHKFDDYREPEIWLDLIKE